MSGNLNSLIGLANIGNTCFFNAVLQALRLCPVIGTIFLADEPLSLRAESKHTQLVSAFQLLMKDFWKESAPNRTKMTMLPRGFFNSLFQVLEETNNGWYQRGQQADASEAIQYIMESLHDGMYRSVKMTVSGSASNCEEVSQVKALDSWSTHFSKEYSPIVQNFYGQSQKCVRCTHCKSTTERYEPWLMIKTAIPGGDVVGGPAPTLSACLAAEFAPETIDDYQCDSCKKRGKAIITTRISRLPPIVILNVKRFTNAGNKVRGKLAWDLDEFDLSSILAFSRNPFGEESMFPAIYETFAVIEHHGSLQGGHYTMFAKQNDGWLEYDDNSISDVTPDRVVSADSYIIFLIPKKDKDNMNRLFSESVHSLRQKNSAPSPA